jgi:hypothetical protein
LRESWREKTKNHFNKMQIEATQAIRDVENLLRDFIAGTLEKSFGSSWTEKCGVTPERIDKWKQRKEMEQRRQEGGVVEPRIIYYADFYDLWPILKKNWEKFSPALPDLKTVEVYLGELEKMRDAGAHGRDLLPHQKHLANGIAGEIRSRLIRFRSKQETSEDYFPRIESARDSLGNVWTPETGTGLSGVILTNHILRPEDIIEFMVTASDPMGAALQYSMEVAHKVAQTWQAESTFSLTIIEGYIGKSFYVEITIKSSRPHHAHYGYDDRVSFLYTVLPKK